MKMPTALALLILAAGPLSAQTLWRCGPDGRSFQATPCVDGAPVALRAAPTPQAVAEARAVAARERDANRRLAAERGAREREAAAQGWGPAGIRPQAQATARKTIPIKAADKKGAPAPGVTPWWVARSPAD
jgi:hypothetical protein